jgi:hypothetical protein
MSNGDVYITLGDRYLEAINFKVGHDYSKFRSREKYKEGQVRFVKCRLEATYRRRDNHVILPTYAQHFVNSRRCAHYAV